MAWEEEQNQTDHRSPGLTCHIKKGSKCPGVVTEDRRDVGKKEEVKDDRNKGSL